MDILRSYPEGSELISKCLKRSELIIGHNDIIWRREMRHDSLNIWTNFYESILGKNGINFLYPLSMHSSIDEEMNSHTRIISDQCSCIQHIRNSIDEILSPRNITWIDMTHDEDIFFISMFLKLIRLIQ
jgi:hypothetical protein